MLTLFWTLGGRIGFNKLDIVVTGATLACFTRNISRLFTIFGGCTPGMMLCRLRVMSFDGGVPTSRQMAWRSFGYLVSAGTCFLGFLWALWMKSNSAGTTAFRGRISHRLKSLHKAQFQPLPHANREPRARHFRQNSCVTILLAMLYF